MSSFFRIGMADTQNGEVAIALDVDHDVTYFTIDEAKTLVKEVSTIIELHDKHKPSTTDVDDLLARIANEAGMQRHGSTQ